MGINGLLPLLKSIHKPCNLKKFDGKTLGVDAYGWLHRGTVSCAMELAMGRPTRKFVDFAMHRVRMLQHFGVTPYIVFDGDYLPSKAATEAERSKRREDSKKAGMELLDVGKTSQAYLEFQKAVDVTPEMARQFIDELKKVGVQYIVAPYEADAQMVYLERKGIIDGIISEDSDLLVFGAKCLLTKLDQYGNCIEINKADFCAVKEISLTGWSDVEFRRMAILSGCDYLASMSNMGLKTAYRMVRKHKTIEKVLRMLQFDGKFLVPKGYLESYQRAELTFLHQRVFCPIALRLVLHTEPEQPLDDLNLPFLGAYVEPEIAQGVARGDLNPITKEPIVVVQRSKTPHTASPWTSTRSKPQRPASIGEAMKGKPIDTFFKGKRVPLAELDINCFTPSPTQQDALRRNSGPWMADPVPRPYLRQSLPGASSQTPSATSHASPLTGRTTRTLNVSEPRPIKRARLCEDIDISPLQSQKSETGRSRFFNTAPDPSPSVKRNARSRKSKTHDITIFSDDSVEEAMLSIVGTDTRMEVYKEQEAVISNVELVKTGAESQPGSISGVDTLDASQTTIPSLTASTSMTSSAEQPSTPNELSPLPSSFRNLRERFTARAISTPTSTMPKNGNPTPASTGPRPSRIPLAVKTAPVQPPAASFFARSNLTPLQRLGATAANKSRLPVTPPITPVSASVKNKAVTRSRSLLSKHTVPFPEAATEARNLIVEPASIPLPKPDENEKMALQAQASNGSEDLIVHDSEEECMSPVSAETSAMGLPRLDLKQFVYAR